MIIAFFPGSTPQLLSCTREIRWGVGPGIEVNYKCRDLSTIILHSAWKVDVPFGTALTIYHTKRKAIF